MPILDYAHCEKSTIEFLSIIKNVDTAFYEFCNYNYNFGFRYNELKNTSRWHYNGNDNFLVTTEKGSNNRIVPINGVPKEFIECINDNSEGFATIRYSTFIRLFKKYYPYPYLSVGNKRVSSHLFRYLVVKRLSLQGLSIQEISTFIGEVNILNTLGYLNAIFHY